MPVQHTDSDSESEYCGAQNSDWKPGPPSTTAGNAIGAGLHFEAQPFTHVGKGKHMRLLHWHIDDLIQEKVCSKLILANGAAPGKSATNLRLLGDVVRLNCVARLVSKETEVFWSQARINGICAGVVYTQIAVRGVIHPANEMKAGNEGVWPLGFAARWDDYRELLSNYVGRRIHA